MVDLGESLFTIMLDLQGSVYITQLFSDTPRNALKAWCLQKDKTIAKDQQIQIYAGLEDDADPAPIEGLDNIWCYLVTTNKGNYLFHVIRTVSCH